MRSQRRPTPKRERRPWRPEFVKVEPFDLVVFGGTGDLAYRKLYPALFHREMSEQFTEPTRIIGVSRRHFDREAFRASVKDALVKFGPADVAPSPFLDRFLRASTTSRSTPSANPDGTN